MKNPFDYFDKIYCICGEHETTRWERCCEQFEKLGIMDRVERFSDFATQEELKKCKMNGCKHSHLSVLKKARSKNLSNVFIFESDFHFVNYDFDLMKKIFESLNNVDWMMFFARGAPHVAFKVANQYLVQASVSLAHAYAVSGKHLDFVIDKLEKHPQIINDQIYRRGKKFKIGYSSYISYPQLVVQKDSSVETHRRTHAAKLYDRRLVPMMKKYLEDK